MDPFETFQHHKAQLEQFRILKYQFSEAVFPTLSNESKKFPFLNVGAGSEHCHMGFDTYDLSSTSFSLGVRINCDHAWSTEEKMGIYDSYIEQVIEAYNANLPTLTIVGGVRVRKNDVFGYGVLVNDFSKMRTQNIEPAKMGAQASIVNGNELYHDFKYDAFDLDRHAEGELKFMHEVKMLCIDYCQPKKK